MCGSAKQAFEANAERVPTHRWMGICRAARSFKPFWSRRLIATVFADLLEEDQATALQPIRASHLLRQLRSCKR